MDHAEVSGLAKTWIDKCKCVNGWALKKEDYPTRLISLAELKRLGTIDAEKWIYHKDLEPDELGSVMVNIVDTNDLEWEKLKNKAYVTLSHRWGGTDKPVKLTKDTERAFRKGLRTRDLPRTFQEAIHFAVRLDHRVHYIWIDSLCIIQGDKQDWLIESDRMQEVYRNSFLNISATAAKDSSEGLYSHRVPQHLWEEVVLLDVDGLDRGAEKVRAYRPENDSDTQHRGPDTADTAGPTTDSESLQVSKIQSCLIVDVSNWETLVNQAPVNKRGWVVQERLLAPRVLHFCHGRIAWECAEFEDIEGHAAHMPNYRLIGDEIYEGIPIKGLQPGEHGKMLRFGRLRGAVEPFALNGNDPETKTVHSLELWSRIVEVYCKTDLTENQDKLIALSGLAQRMADTIAASGIERDQIRYMAGLWNVRLASQLLWHIEPVYKGESDSSSGTIEYLSKRPKRYRAPSFSWASVDAQFGNGITCGHVRNSGNVLVEIPQNQDDNWLGQEAKEWKQSLWISHETTNQFGIVKSGHIRLWAWVHHVKLQRKGAHYSWSLLANNTTSAEPDKRSKDDKENFNVYLDCPNDDDQDNKLIHSDEIYCLPMAYGSFSSSMDLVCLLLIKASDDNRILKWPDDYRQWTFKRIGYTKLSDTFDHFTWNYISNFSPSDKVSDEFYDETTGRSLVCII